MKKWYQLNSATNDVDCLPEMLTDLYSEGVQSSDIKIINKLVIDPDGDWWDFIILYLHDREIR